MVWANLSGAQYHRRGPILPRQTSPRLAQGPFGGEKHPRNRRRTPPPETNLFHLHNLALAEGPACFADRRRRGAHWGLHLPNLTAVYARWPPLQRLSGPMDSC